MAGLRFCRSAAGPARRAGHLPRPSAGLCFVPPVRHLEALAGVLGRPETARRAGRDGRRHDRRGDGGLAGAGRPVFPAVMFAAELLTRAEKLLADARAKKLKIATAESCTGGLIAG